MQTVCLFLYLLPKKYMCLPGGSVILISMCWAHVPLTKIMFFNLLQTDMNVPGWHGLRETHPARWWIQRFSSSSFLEVPPAFQSCSSLVETLGITVMSTAVIAWWELYWSVTIPAHTLGTCCNTGDNSHVTGSNHIITQSVLRHFTTRCHLEHGTERA